MAPYKRNAKRTYAKKRYVKKTGVSTAVKKYVKRVLPHVEMKRQYDVLSEATLNSITANALFYEPIITQGSTVLTRNGNQINMKGIHLKVVMRNNAAVTQLVRVLIIRIAGEAPLDTTLELFQDASGVGGTANTTDYIGSTRAITAQIDKRWKVYFDRMIKFSASTATDGSDVKTLSHFAKCNTVIKYDANNTGLNNQNYRFGIIYILSEGANDAVAGLTLEVTGEHKYYFTDS